MKIQKAERRKAKIKMALQGPSGSGKTKSALLLAFGLTSAWNKIAVIDTENYSSSLYDSLGDYNIVDVTAPFTPEKYVEALALCHKEGMEVVIIDSISHEWEGLGGILDQHSQMTGNSFTNWGKLTPRHNKFVQTVLQSSMHIIGTIRSKQDYVMVEKNGRQVPEKVGMKGVQRDGLDYEFTLVFDLDMKHNANASKDRTELFMDKPEFKITPDTGKQILQWCNGGKDVDEGFQENPIDTNYPILTWQNKVQAKDLSPEQVIERIGQCKSLNELLHLYHANPKHQDKLIPDFQKKRKELEEIVLKQRAELFNN